MKVIYMLDIKELCISCPGISPTHFEIFEMVLTLGVEELFYNNSSSAREEL